jgi:hypothetical protein
MPYFWLYSQKVCHCCHWYACQFSIRDHKGMSDSCTFSIRSSGQWCLVFRDEARSQKLTDRATFSLNMHSQVSLLWHFTMTYCSCDCLIDNRQFLLPWCMNCVTKAICCSKHKLENNYLVQTMKSSLKRLCHWKRFCDSSGTYWEDLYNYGVVFNTRP